MFFATGDYPDSIPCTARTFDLTVRPARGAIAAYGRCGHFIFTRHTLVIQPGNDEGTVTVTDTAAREDKNRGSDGERPLGRLGQRFGLSVHRCDECRRSWSLRRSLICPRCVSTIPEGSRVKISTAAGIDPHMLDTVATRTLPDGGVVVCAKCEATNLHPIEDGDDGPKVIWTDGRLLVFQENSTYSE